MLLLAAVTGCSVKETEVKYYCISRVAEMPAISAASRMEMAYDDQWRLVSEITYNDNDDTEVNARYLEYNEDGTEVSVVQRSDGQENRGQFQRTYDEKGNLLKEIGLEDGEEVLSNEYTYDTNGNVLSSIVHPQAPVVIRNSFEYDDRGNRISHEQITSYDRQETAFTTKTEYLYDEKDHLIREDIYADGVLGNYAEYEFDEETNTEYGKRCTPDGTVTGKTRRVYDEAGNLLLMEQMEPDGTVISRTIQTWAGTDGSISEFSE